MLVAFGEFIAEQAILKYQDLNVTMDHQGLRNDMVNCLAEGVSKIMFRYMEIAADLTSPESFTVLHNLQSNLSNFNIANGFKLNDEQKQLIASKVLAPFCQTVVPLAFECEKPEYKHILEITKYDSAVEKVVQQLPKAIFKDACRNDANWVFELIEANPQQCVNVISIYARTPENQMCKQEWACMIIDLKHLSRPSERFQFESNQQFCNLTEMYRRCLSNLLIDSCPQNPKFGDILLNIFTESRSWLNAKCGTMNLTASFRFVMLFAIVGRFLKVY